MQALLHSVPLTLQEITTNLHLCQRLLDTHGQVWVSLLWDHCSFLLGPSMHKFVSVLSKILSPQSCISPGGSMVGLVVTSGECWMPPKRYAMSKGKGEAQERW